ncbi:MAG: HIT family protein [Rhodomicrobiaceae bacterium]
MNYDDNNIFAKILRKEIPSHVIFEDEHTLAIMDVMPQSDGHALVIPKSPSVNLLDASSESLSHTISIVQVIARAGMKAFQADGITIQQFNNAAGGQSVFHTHFHVIPRYDGITLKGHTGEMADAELIKTQATKYIDALNT